MNCPHGARCTCNPRILLCDTHGGLPYHGEVICAPSVGGCGAVWKLEKDADVPPPELGKHCVCGRSLVGPEGTARAICAKCYRERKAQAS